jgi:predicted deacylase
MDRRKFIKNSLIATTLIPSLGFAHSTKRNHFIMPPKPFEYFIKEGKIKGGKILIIGGIHGNEPGGYKTSDILIDTKIKKGIVAILPRSNPESIFTFKRGYNGDMNRKFSYISKKDKDYYKINSIKNFIKDFKPDLILSLHDGYGYFNKNHNQWGESIVIDEAIYNNIPLFQTALSVNRY